MNVKYKVLYIDLESDPVWKKYRLMVRERLLSRMNTGGGTIWLLQKDKHFKFRHICGYSEAAEKAFVC